MSNKWYWYTRGTIHPHRADQALLGVRYFGPKLNIRKFYRTLYINIGDKLYWAWDDEEIRSVGQRILEVCSKISGQREHIAKFKFYLHRAIKAAAKVRSLDLRQMTNQQLIDWYDYLLIHATPAHGFLDVDIDAIDVVSEEFLQRQIIKTLPKSFNMDNFVELYQKLATPLYESYLAKEKREIIKVASRHYSDADIQKFYQKYWWTSLGWESMRMRNLNYFKQAIRRFKNKKHAKQELTKLNVRLKNIGGEKNRLLRKYKLGPQIKYWLKFFDVYTYLHDFRKEMQMKTVYSFYLLLKEAARRFKLNVNDLEWLYYEDIKNLLRGKKLDKKEINNRKKAVYVLVSRKGITRYSGTKAWELAQKFLKHDSEQVKSFKGMPVTQGKIKGRVKVCSGSQEAIRKVKTGEVLVCGMTLPDYVPAMKRAGAIITDEGGITCHAAIIARELNKPCVVGTKIATKVLKDGDFIDVNANHGVITVIKRK